MDGKSINWRIALCQEDNKRMLSYVPKSFLDRKAEQNSRELKAEKTQ